MAASNRNSRAQRLKTKLGIYFFSCNQICGWPVQTDMKLLSLIRDPGFCLALPSVDLCLNVLEMATEEPSLFHCSKEREGQRAK